MFPPDLSDLAPVKYELRALLRSSCSTRTLLAVDSSLDTYVELTLIDPDCASREAWQRFERLISDATRAQIPELIIPHTISTEDYNKCFCVSEVQTAYSIDRMRASDAAKWQPILTAGEQIAEVLERLHAKLGPHLGLSPARCLITSTGGFRLLDFGLSIFEAKHPNTGDYSAPELSSQLGRARSDIFALGVILFELLAGVRPQNTTSLRAFTPVPHSVDRCISRMLASNPSLRHSDVRELRIELRHLLGLPGLLEAEQTSPSSANPEIIPQEREPPPIAKPSWRNLVKKYYSELDPVSSSSQEQAEQIKIDNHSASHGNSETTLKLSDQSQGTSHEATIIITDTPSNLDPMRSPPPVEPPMIETSPKRGAHRHTSAQAKNSTPLPTDRHRQATSSPIEKTVPLEMPSIDQHSDRVPRVPRMDLGPAKAGSTLDFTIGIDRPQVLQESKQAAQPVPTESVDSKNSSGRYILVVVNLVWASLLALALYFLS